VAPAKRRADLVVSGQEPTRDAVLRVLAQLSALEPAAKAAEQA